MGNKYNVGDIIMARWDGVVVRAIVFQVVPHVNVRGTSVSYEYYLKDMLNDNKYKVWESEVCL